MLERIGRFIQPVQGSAEPAPDDAAILLCEFRGVIHDGSSGNLAVEAMAHTIEHALSRGCFRAVLLDITAVRYTFGDQALGLLMRLRHRGLGLALVVSEQCNQLGTFAQAMGGWTVCTSRRDALQKLRSAAEGDA